MVRPPLGVVEPGKKVEVSVMLNYVQAHKDGVDLAAVRDRFQVVAVGIENASKEDLLKVWTTAPEAAITKTVVKCKFVTHRKVKVVDEAASPMGTRSLDTSSVQQQSFASPATLDRSGSNELAANASPTLEEARAKFKTEMASTKLKKEMAALREEKEQAEERLKTRDQRIFALEAQLSRLRDEPRTDAGSAAANRAGGGSVLGVASSMWSAFAGVLLALLFLLVVYLATGWDPLAAVHSAVSMRVVAAKTARALEAFVKA